MANRFFSDARQFLAVAGDHLAAEPVVSTVVTSYAHLIASQAAEGIAQPEHDWWVAVTDDADPAAGVLGVAMRTNPFPPHPAYLLPMPAEAAVALAQELVGRGEEVLAANGALPTVEVFLAEVARLTGGRPEVAERTRLHEITELTPARPVPGELVPATVEEADLIRDWLVEFAADADEQAGRPRGAGPREAPDPESIRRRIGEFHFWLDGTGQRVHVTGARPPAFGVARIGPVFTPAAQRGHGWASAAVGELSRRLLAGGSRVCLFTDQDNPTSNRIYAALGYRPVVDMANMIIRR